MTQAIERLQRQTTLQVEIRSLAPVQSIESVPTAIRGGATEDIDLHTLLLHPGEASEIAVRISNPGEQPQRFRVDLEEMPEGIESACQIDALQLVRGSVGVAEVETTEFSLMIRATSEFFERQHAITREHPRLQIDYPIQVCVYQLEQSGSRLVSYQSLRVAVRPQTTYLDFLPSVFRDVDFASRFLFIFEQAFDPYVQTLDTLWAYLDPLTAPETLLPFLAHWVAWRIEPEIELSLQRRLIRNAVELYRWHGTRQGLRLYLHFYTGLPCDQTHIRIEEVFSSGLTLGDCQFGQNALIGGGRPYHFIVSLHPEAGHPEIDEALVRRVIEREKPPFCTYDLMINLPI
jgi:phage tail-like protein